MLTFRVVEASTLIGTPLQSFALRSGYTFKDFHCIAWRTWGWSWPILSNYCRCVFNRSLSSAFWFIRLAQNKDKINLYKNIHLLEIILLSPKLERCWQTIAAIGNQWNWGELSLSNKLFFKMLARFSIGEGGRMILWFWHQSIIKAAEGILDVEKPQINLLIPKDLWVQLSIKIKKTSLFHYNHILAFGLLVAHACCLKDKGTT